VLEGEREERSDFSDRSANLSDQSDVEFVFSFNIEDAVHRISRSLRF
jgi:hypothetical protein